MHATALTFDALDLADDLQFPSIARRGFVCSRCGARTVSVMPAASGGESVASLREASGPLFERI